MDSKLQQEREVNGGTPFAEARGSVNVRFKIRMCCDYGGGAKWGQWHDMEIKRELYGQMLDKLMADKEVKAFDIEPSSPNGLHERPGAKTQKDTNAK